MMHSERFFTYGRFIGHSFFGSGWTWLVVIGAALLVTAVVVLIVRGLKKNTIDSDALEALNLKFVKGEIDEEEYQKRKSVLTGK